MPELNLGTVVFIIVLLYLVISVFIYLLTDHTVIYEVNKGTLLKNSSYTGVAIREENLLVADTKGYINYFVSDGEKIPKNYSIYTLTPEPLSVSVDTSSNENPIELTDSEIQEAASIVTDYSSVISNTKINDTEKIKNSLGNVIYKNNSAEKSNTLYSIIDAANGESPIYTAQTDGIISLMIDGYESLTTSSVTRDTFNSSSYDSNYRKSNTTVSAGSPVAKLITSEQWSIVFELDESEVQLFSEIEQMEVTFEDDSKMNGSFEIIKGNNLDYGVLTFTEGMIQHISERFINFEINISDSRGLKIPNSIIFKQNTYKIPTEYVIKDDTLNKSYLLTRGKNNDVVRKEIRIIHRDEEHVYVSHTELEKGIKIISENSSNLYTVSQTVELTGVYNVDDGYTKFMYVDVLSSDSDYSIVRDNSDYSLRNYDHIVLDASTSQNDEIL